LIDKTLPPSVKYLISNKKIYTQGGSDDQR
jgi:hypothetical protein